MRQIEKAMCAAVKAQKNWTLSNTSVCVENGVVKVYLHHNLIYRVEGGRKYFRLAGWNTVTTRSRLRALGVNVSCRNYTPQYNGEDISTYDWYEDK